MNAMTHIPDDPRARIEILVEPVTEAHQSNVIGFVLDPGQKSIDLGDRAYLLQHVEHGLIGTAVRRSPERRYSGGNRRVGVRAGASGQAHRGRTGVLLVIGMQDEQQVERFGRHGVGRIGLRRSGEQ